MGKYRSMARRAAITCTAACIFLAMQASLFAATAPPGPIDPPPGGPGGEPQPPGPDGKIYIYAYNKPTSGTRYDSFIHAISRSNYPEINLITILPPLVKDRDGKFRRYDFSEGNVLLRFALEPYKSPVSVNCKSRGRGYFEKDFQYE
ncbi:MAG: hypothetical protein ABH875_02895, partial [Candidatus Omnitrophota bacterium]